VVVPSSGPKPGESLAETHPELASQQMRRVRLTRLIEGQVVTAK
jgi:hypothetical protein